MSRHGGFGSGIDIRIQVAFALEILGLDYSAIGDKAAIESAFKRLARTVHPDICHGPEAERLMILATKCRDMLQKVERRPPRRVPTGPEIVVTWTNHGVHSWDTGN